MLNTTSFTNTEIKNIEQSTIRSKPCNASYADAALTVIETEAQAILALRDRIDSNFDRACEILLQTQGRIIVTGIGKSGHIARKIAATFASTGSPAFFVHPAEACHGDLGMIIEGDTVLAISNSGSNQELITLLPLLKRLRLPLIAMTSGMDSPLSQAADVILDISVSAEACPLGLAPTTSTTVTLVLGDALAMALLQARGFTVEQFAFSHPGGQLGRRLLLRVEDIMHSGDALPLVQPHCTVAETLVTMSAKRFGCAIIVDDQNRLAGFYSDGDLRRTLEKEIVIKNTLVCDVMTPRCQTIRPEQMAVEALNRMQECKITALVVTDAEHRVTGLIHMHDLLRHGIY